MYALNNKPNTSRLVQLIRVYHTLRVLQYSHRSAVHQLVRGFQLGKQELLQLLALI